jgi:hypothetical protein
MFRELPSGELLYRRADFLIKLSKLALTRSIIDRHDIASKRIIPSKIRDRVLSSQIL